MLRIVSSTSQTAPEILEHKEPRLFQLHSQFTLKTKQKVYNVHTIDVNCIMEYDNSKTLTLSGILLLTLQLFRISDAMQWK